MKFIKKCPLFIIIISIGILLTIAAIGGKNSIYKEQEYQPLKAPILSVLFTGLNDGIYPWQLFTGTADETVSMKEETEDTSEAGTDVETDTDAENVQGEAAEEKKPGESQDTAVPSASESPGAMPTATPAPTATPTPTPPSITEGRLEPLRESTHEEYMNHISADIYGDAGVIRAASYEFDRVDESYFDDALFIGDSRTVGLHDYTDLTEHADFLCETSLTIYKVMEEDFKGKGTVEEVLANKDYGKIYIMVGINELGRGTTEDFMAKYTEVIDTIHELEPGAMIFIQGIMRVSGTKNANDKIFNNSNINARNNAIATLADNKQIFYIDVNEVVCDEEGNLNEEYTFDQIHLLGVHNGLWKDFLLSHGVVKEENN